MYSFKRFMLTSMAISIGLVNFSCYANTHIADKKNYVLNHIHVKEGDQIKTMTLPEAMAHFKVPAISFSVIQSDKISWVDAIGYTDSDHTKKVNTGTLFQAGSMSKSVAAITALSLVDRGILNLDSAVTPLLRGWVISKPDKFKDEAVTLRQLLSMSSGLNVGGYYGYAPGQPLPMLIQTLNGMKPANNPPLKMIYQPGKQYYYSGGGYEVIQLLINSQTSSSFIQNVQNYVLTPLGMVHSNYDQPLAERFAKNAALATNSDGNTFTYKWRITPEYAAAGLWSTPTDLAKFVLSVMKAYQGKNGEVISATIAKDALTQQKNTPYGLGFVVKGKSQTLRFMKLGQNAGYQGWLAGLPNTGQGVIVMTNSDNGRELAQDLIYAIAKAYQWPTNGRMQDAWMVK